jgi:hypothetical protein
MNTNLEPPYRVKHSTIPVSAFKPDKSNGYRPKVLRWSENEHRQPDSLLRVENEREGYFELWADLVSPVLLTLPAGGGVTAATGAESLDQTIVDKIEVAPNAAQFQGCDFVIFQNSKQIRELCQHKGQ